MLKNIASKADRNIAALMLATAGSEPWFSRLFFYGGGAYLKRSNSIPIKVRRDRA